MKENKNASLHQLDAILEYLYFSSNPNFKESEHPFPEWIEYFEVSAITDKLAKDGYIIQNKNNIRDIKNFISFEGKLFYENTSYVSNAKYQMLQKKSENVKSFLLIVFSGLAAIGSISVVIVELLKHFVWDY